jgi:hypothetical protein
MECWSKFVATHTVNQHADERRVEAIFCGKGRNLTKEYQLHIPTSSNMGVTHKGVRHSLRDHNHSDRKSSNNIARCPTQVYTCW